jgi:hypothetical protein
MVAAEKYARAQAETRSRQAEENLAAAEAAMRDMQAHLQSLPTMLLDDHPYRVYLVHRLYPDAQTAIPVYGPGLPSGSGHLELAFSAFHRTCHPGRYRPDPATGHGARPRVVEQTQRTERDRHGGTRYRARLAQHALVDIGLCVGVPSGYRMCDVWETGRRQASRESSWGTGREGTLAAAKSSCCRTGESSGGLEILVQTVLYVAIGCTVSSGLFGSFAQPATCGTCTPARLRV